MNSVKKITRATALAGFALAAGSVFAIGGSSGPNVTYDVSRRQLLTHAGVPVFGLYCILLRLYQHRRSELHPHLPG